MKKYLSLFLVLVMLISSMPLNVFAEGEDAQSDEGSVSVAATEESAEDAKQDTKEEPAKVEPKQEEPAKEEPAKAETKQEEPADEQPADKQPADEQPADKQPADEQPADKQPADEQPADKEPADEQPADKQPADKEPADEQPADKEPADEQPAGEEPADEEPADEQPADEEPADEQPADGQPAEDESAEGQQGVADPLLPADGVTMDVPALDDPLMEFASPMTEITGFKLKEKTNESVTLTWKGTDADEGYLIQYGYGSNPFSSSITKSEPVPAGETTWTISGLEIGRTYSFQIIGLYSDGKGGTNRTLPTVLGETVLMCPYPPEDLDITAVSTTNAQLKWSEPEKGTTYVTGYYVERINPDGSTATKYQAGADKTEFLSRYLKVGQTYTYRVYSYYTPSKSTEKILSEKYAEATFTVKLPAPKNPEAASISLKEIKVTWDDVSGADGYEVWRRRGSIGDYALIGEAKAADKPSFIDNGSDIYPGFEYWYYIVPFCNGTVVDDEGISYTGHVKGDRTGEFSAIVYPPAPTTIKAVYQSDSEIEITWSAVTDVEGYILEGSDDNETWTAITLPNVRATSYLETGLAVGQTRYYRVKSFVKLASGNIESEKWSAVVSDTPRPLAPTNLELTNPDSYNQIKLSWDASEGAAGYEILRSTSSSTTPTSVVGDTDLLEWTNEKLTCGKEYFYRVRAYVYDTNGVKRVGPATETKSLKARPAVPTILTADQADADAQYTNSVKLTWTRVEGATGYYIYAKQDGGAIKQLTTASGTTDSVQEKTVYSLNLKSDYVFYVAAYRTVNGSAVVGDRSEPVELTMEMYAPQELDFTRASATSVKLTWKKMYGITGYEVNVTCDDDPGFSLIKKTTANSLTVTGLSSRYNYTATVRAYKKGQTYEYGNVSDEKTFYTMPAAPTKLVLKTKPDSDTGDLGVGLTWTEVADCDGYIVERSTSKDSGYTVIMEPREGAQNRTFVDKGPLSVGEKYYYRVRAYSESTNKTDYGYVHASSPITNSLTLPPAQVTGLKAEGAGTTQVKLTWNKTAGADGYYVYRKTGSGDYVRLTNDDFTDEGDTISFLAKGLKAGTEYTFRVRAYVDGTSKTYGAYSGTVSIRPAPLAPENVYVYAVAAKRVALSWDRPAGATSYKIYAVLADDSTKYMMTVSSTKSKVYATVKGLEYNMPYRFVVAACANGATGPQSEPSNEVTTELGMTSTSVLAAGSTAIKLDWSALSDASGYEVQMRSSGSEWRDVGSTTASEYTVKSLSLGQPYDFRVRAYLNTSEGRVYRSGGGWEEITHNYVTPSAPTEFKARGWGRNYIRMSWKSIAGADGYNIYYRKKGASTWDVKQVDGELETDTITVTIDGLSSNTSYEYFVRAFVRTDLGTDQTGWKTKTLTTKTVK